MTPLFWLRWVRRICAALVAVAVLVVGTTAFRVWWVARQDARPHSDAIIVMGAAQYNGTPTEIFAARLQHAAALYRAHVAPRVITVGGREPGDRTTEGATGAAYLRRSGIATAALVPVGVGSDTYASLAAAAHVMRVKGWHTAVIVTDPWHALRSRTMARDLGIRAVTSPDRTGPVVRSRSTEWRYVGRETLAYLSYQVFGASSIKGPPAA